MDLNKFIRSESQPTEEEPYVLGFIVLCGVGLVSIALSHSFSELFSEFVSSFGGLQVFFFEFLEVEVIHHESSWHHVILIHAFDEGLYSCSLYQFFLVNASFDSFWVACDSDQH